MKKLALLLNLPILACLVFFTNKDPVEPKMQMINELISKMTLEEKAGQLSLFVAGVVTGPKATATSYDKYIDQVKKGRVGGYFNGYGAEFTEKLQKVAVEESRLGIPLLFGADVIHGFRTAFPIPLAEAASWDMEAVEMGSRVAAIEATAVGLNWNFAPMVDVARDPRWGRVAEGSGEDTYLGCQVAKARVKGFQGDDLTKDNTLAACVKHLVGYAVAEGGRDYNTTDISERNLRDVYLPPFKAAIDAGAASIMTSFNDLNGVPLSANKFIVNDILKEEWGFDGFVVSDYNSIGELVTHGIAANDKHAGELSINSGSDMDMEGSIFIEYLPQLIKEGKVKESVVDEAVRRILKIKYDLGLFDNPYKYSNSSREKELLLNKKHQEIAKDVARKSIVLLKNENNILPLSKKGKRLALIGPFAKEQAVHNGTWSFFANTNDPVSIEAGIKNKTGKNNHLIVDDCGGVYNITNASIKRAIKKAEKADIIIASVGESSVMNGEAASRSEIGLPNGQLKLLKALHQTGKPIVVLLTNGRPLTINWLDENADAILETWHLGTQAGNAIADVLFGDYNPSGKLPMSFPRKVGQIPLYYNAKNTGRPKDLQNGLDEKKRIYDSRYKDIPNSPLYPFGFGLSYTSFEYSNLKINKSEISFDETLEISATIINTGKVKGEEVVQLYIRDLVGSVTRPIKELKGFQKIHLQAGESKKVTFQIKVEDLAFHKLDMTYGAEEGDFKVYVGGNSQDLIETRFSLKTN